MCSVTQSGSSRVVGNREGKGGRVGRELREGGKKAEEIDTCLRKRGIFIVDILVYPTISQLERELMSTSLIGI